MSNDKTFDIWNDKPRAVKCISISDDVYGGRGGEDLELGAIYHVTSVEVHGYLTEVFLAEKPDDIYDGYNSVLFEEIEV